MSHSRNFKSRSILRFLPSLLRALVIVALAFLLFSLIVPSIGGAGLTTFAFQSPGESPPDPDPPGPSKSPPGQSHSPPGPFHTPPGQFHSPPGPFHSPLPPNRGGNGNGLGPDRHVDLNYVPDSMVYAPDAFGKITIVGTYPKTSKWADFPQGINYTIHNLPCQDFVHYGDYNSGRWFYSLYLITESGARYRLQSFNPGCPNSKYFSWTQTPNIPEELLFNEDLVFEVHVELDDSMNTPDFYYYPSLVMRGQDTID